MGDDPLPPYTPGLGEGESGGSEKGGRGVAGALQAPAPPHPTPGEAGSVWSSRLTVVLESSRPPAAAFSPQRAAGHCRSRRGLSRGTLICVLAVPSSQRKGGEWLTYLSKPHDPPRVFLSCGNSGL